jgi:cation diffusion facilitator family transporter
VSEIRVALKDVLQLSRPRVGYGSDVGGRRTPWIVGGMAVLALGGVVAAVGTAMMEGARAAGIAVAVLGFLLIGLGVGAAGTTLLVLLARLVDEARRPAAASIVWMMMIAGFAITAGVAGHFLDPYSPQRLVLVSAIVVGLTHWYWLDAATGIAVGLAVAWTGWGLLRDAMQVALDAVPPGIEMAAVDQALRNLPGVLDVHHLHVWGMSTSQIALTAHVVRRPLEVDDMDLLHQAKERLAEMGIAHSTIQLEPPSP